MKLTKYLVFLSLIVFMITGSILSCDFTLSGKVTDADENPVEDAEVKVTDELTATTDSEGDYSITGIPYDSYVVMITHPQYDMEVLSIDSSYLDNGLSCKEISGDIHFGKKTKWKMV